MKTSPDSLPPVNDYERTAFFQVLGRLARRRGQPVFGKGLGVTRDDVRDAFFAVNPDYADATMAETLFDMMVFPALTIEVEENGYKVVTS